MAEQWWLIVPWLTEAALVACCLRVWSRLRQLGLHGVGRWTLGVIVVDAAGQTWSMGARAGQPAGVGWFSHVVLGYLMVYVVLRLGELLCRGQSDGEAATSGQCWPSLAKSEETRDA